MARWLLAHADATADTAAWQRSVERILSDRKAIEDIVRTTRTRIYAPIAHGYGGHTLLRGGAGGQRPQHLPH
ncbi:MAG: hypothetical protein U0694_07415 [Anaerolineae bacterium]